MAERHRRSRYLTISILQIITIICQALSEEPMFAEPIPNVTVAVGRDANLPCVINNLGSYKVAWLHVGRQMLLTIHTHVVIKIPRFSVSYDKQRTWLLVIKSVEQQDRGYYMCQVNTDPMISQVGFLQVIVPPNILDSLSTESNVAVREHQNITLTCKADGYPTPVLSWRREDGQAIMVDRRNKVDKYDGEQLNLTKITRNEMGAYLCIAKNGVPPTVSKRITVEVEFSPMIWVPNQLVGAPAGTNVSIDCHTEAHPRAISYWSLNKTMILPNDKYSTETNQNSYRMHMRLTIRNLEAGDFGSYQCISKNSLGETEGSVRLYEMPKPSAPPRATEIKSSANKEAGKQSTVYRWDVTRRWLVTSCSIQAVVDGAPEGVPVQVTHYYQQRRQQSTTQPPKRLTTIWPAPYNPYYTKRTEKPPSNEKKIERPEQKPRGHSTGSAYIIRWSAPQLMVVAVQYILTGPYMPPYVPQNPN